MIKSVGYIFKDARVVVLLVFLIILALYYFSKNIHLSEEATDNAIVKCDLIDVVPEVPGIVQGLHIVDNERVEQNDLIINIRDDVYRAVASVAESDYKIQKKEMDILLGQLKLDENDLRYSERHLTRMKQLKLSRSISDDVFDDAEQDYQKRLQNVENTKAKLVLQTAKIDSASAKWNEATVRLEQTRIHALRSGIVTNRRISEGEYMNTGQTIASITSCEESAWVDANFKETQISRIKPGQIVQLHVDAFPDTVMRGEVESISSGSGSTFSVLPPENATGNFTKVVQRFPVRIKIVDTKNKVLRTGLSVVVSIKVVEEVTQQIADKR
jgi:membrane fusion protein (multidrug efflux system)